MIANAPRLRRLDGRSVPTAELQAFIERTIEKADVAGLSCAIINDGRVVYRNLEGVGEGVRDRGGDDEPGGRSCACVHGESPLFARG